MKIIEKEVVETYSIGDEFTSDVGDAKLISANTGTVQLLMTSGIYKDRTWTGTQVKVSDARKITKDELDKASSHEEFTPKNKSAFEPVIIEIETEDELKAVWGMFNVPDGELAEKLMTHGVHNHDTICIYDMWDSIDDICIKRKLKSRFGKFQE